MAQKAQETGYKEQLLSGHRAEAVDPQRLLAFLPLRPYHTVADVRCGDGYFTIPLAKYLFDGRVYAVDPREGQLQALESRLQALRLTNVERVQAEEAVLAVALPKEGLDGALVAFVLHALKPKQREAFLKGMLGLLKKGGWLAVVEFRKREASEGPPMAQRLSEEEVVELGRGAGYRFTERRYLNDHHYLVVLRK